MAFSERFLTELCDRNDIVDVVSGYVKLTKRSGVNEFGLCPFHSEKTPSFAVRPDMQTFHCFGCGKGGGVINFIMEIENLSFPDAVHFLARRAGLSVPDDEGHGDNRERERLLKINREAAMFFHERLREPEGEPARSYTAARGISVKMIKNFGIGFAPDTWEYLCDTLKSSGYSEMELVKAGVARHGKKGGIYDTFRNRLMFPVIDVRGNVIGFSGRILGDGEPKYMNSPETSVFNKSRNLFALNLAKKSKSGYIILAEGNIDVVALHQAGFDSGVASLGTALTPEQARLISRYTQQVIIAYDSDTAGQKASQRAIGLLEKTGINVRVLSMKGAKDPDEFIRREGVDAFKNLIEKSENHIEYRLQTVAAKYNLESDEEKVSFLREAADLVADIYGGVEREVYTIRVAQMAEIKKEAFELEVNRLRKRKLQSQKRSLEREATRPARAIQPRERELRYENVKSATAEEGLVRLMYLDSGLFRDAEGVPEPGEFSSEALGRIFGELRRRSGEGEPVTMAALGGSLTPEDISLLTGLIQKPEALTSGDRALSDYIGAFRSAQTRDLRGINVSDQEFGEMARELLEQKERVQG